MQMLITIHPCKRLNTQASQQTSETPAHPPASDLGHACTFPFAPSTVFDSFLVVPIHPAPLCSVRSSPHLSSNPQPAVVAISPSLSRSRVRVRPFTSPSCASRPPYTDLALVPCQALAEAPTLVPLSLRTWSRFSLASFPGSFALAPPIGLPRPVVHPALGLLIGIL